MMKNNFSLGIVPILFLITCSIMSSIGQDSPGDNIFPPPPNAASLGQYGDHKVNLYSGSPSINIPIWEIESDGVKLPISLTYNASGIRVEEIASRVGLGWSLNSGGLITRTVRGHRDEIRYIDDFVHRKALDDLEAGEMNYLSKKDLQADIFYYNFNGHTGKFVFDKDGIPHSIPYNKLKIEPNDTWIEDHFINSWTITSEDGTKYIFEEKEYVTNSTNGATQSNYGDGVSSWYLSRIISPESKRACIYFDYANYQVDTYITSRSQSCALIEYQIRTTYSGISPTSYSLNEQKINTGMRIKRIWTQNCQIDFEEGDEREDFPGDFPITSIVINSRTGLVSSPIKEFNLTYGYMARGSLPVNGLPGEESRLMLTEIKETSNNEEKEPYVFTYYIKNSAGRGLPSRLSFAQDHWGGFNGKHGNSHLLPSFNYSYLKVTAADRSPHLGSALCGTLKEIIYPTKGKTLFEYELNEVPKKTIENTAVAAPKEYITHTRSLKTNSEILQNTDITSEQGESYEFTIDEEMTVQLLFAYNPFGSPSNTDFFTDVTTWPVDFELKQKNNESIYHSEWGNRTHGVTLAPGTYEINYEKKKGLAYTVPNESEQFEFGIFWKEEIPLEQLQPNKEVGGLRIKRIQTTDPVSGKINTKTYTYTNNAGESTGRLISVPFYYSRYSTVITCGNEGVVGNHTGSNQTPTTLASTVVFSSNSNQALANTQGSTVGYAAVNINYNGNGSKTQEFTMASDLQWLPNRPGSVNGGSTDRNGNIHLEFRQSSQAPFVPVDSREWQRGLLFRETIFRENGTKVKSTTNRYAIYDERNVNGMPTPNYVLGFKTAPIFMGNPCGAQSYGFSYYSTTWGYTELIEKTETDYDGSGNATVSKTTNYTYNTENLKPSVVTTSNSVGENLETNYYYPHDFPNNAIYQDMVDSNIITPVIKTENRNTTLGKQIRGTEKIYTEPYPGLFLPTRVDKWEEGAGYIPELHLTYNSEGKITSQEIINGITTTYLWGYDGIYPVAKIENARYDEVEGELSPQDLTVLAKSLPTDNQIIAIAQKIRVALSSAMVTGYTYKPLVGVTSQVDPRGQKTTYEYDELGRLIKVRDNEGNILNAYKYNYKK